MSTTMVFGFAANTCSIKSSWVWSRVMALRSVPSLPSLGPEILPNAPPGLLPTHDDGHVRRLRQLDGLAIGVVGRARHRHARPHLVRDALQRGDGVRRPGAVPVEINLVRARTHNGDGLDLGLVQRQQPVGVFQQDNGFLRGELDVGFGLVRRPRLRLIGGADFGVGDQLRRIHQAQPDKDPQLTLDGLVNVGFRQEIVAQRGVQVGDDKFGQ